VQDGLSVRAVEEAVRARGDGEPSPATGKARGPRLRQAGMHELEQLLSEHLATRVTVQETARAGGKVLISFADLDDLERIYRAMTEPRVELDPPSP
jgi:ParB family chromosome partitioning protein